MFSISAELILQPLVGEDYELTLVWVLVIYYRRLRPMSKFGRKRLKSGQYVTTPRKTRQTIK